MKDMIERIKRIIGSKPKSQPERPRLERQQCIKGLENALFHVENLEEIIDDKPRPLIWPAVFIHYSWQEISKDYFAYGSDLVYVCDAGTHVIEDILADYTDLSFLTTLQSFCFLSTFSYNLPSLFSRDMRIEYKNPWPSRELYNQLRKKHKLRPSYDKLENLGIMMLSWKSSSEKDKKVEGRPLLLPKRGRSFSNFIRPFIHGCIKPFFNQPLALFWSKEQMSELKPPNIEDARDVSMCWGWEDSIEVEPGVKIKYIWEHIPNKWYKFFKSLPYYSQLKDQLENPLENLGREVAERCGIELMRWIEWEIKMLIRSYLEDPKKAKEILKGYKLNKNEIDHVLEMLEKAKIKFESERKNLAERFEEYLFKYIFLPSLRLSELVDYRFIASYNLHDSLMFKDGILEMQGLYVDIIKAIYSSPQEFLLSFMDVASKCFDYIALVKVACGENIQTVSVLASNSRMRIKF